MIEHLSEGRRSKAKYLVTAFLVMLETVLEGNRKFSLKEIVADWWPVAFGASGKKQSTRLWHNIVDLEIQLFMKGYRNNNLDIPYIFKILSDFSNHEDFLSTPNHKLNEMQKTISEYTGFEINLQQKIC